MKPVSEREDLLNLFYARGDAAIVAIDVTIESLEAQLEKLKEAREILSEFDRMLEVPENSHKQRLIEAFKSLRPDLADKSDDEIEKILGGNQWKPTTRQ